MWTFFQRSKPSHAIILVIPRKPAPQSLKICPHCIAFMPMWTYFIEIAIFCHFKALSEILFQEDAVRGLWMSIRDAGS